MGFSKKRASFAQGTMEYLIILGIVVIIGLIAVAVTSITLFPIDLQEKATAQQLKSLSISIVEASFNASTEEVFLKLKNNYSNRINITNLKIGDVNSNVDQNLLAGASSIFIISSSGVCENNELVKDLIITFESKYGLEHLQTVKNVAFACNNANISQILRFFYIPNRNLEEGIFAGMSRLSDLNYSLNGEIDLTSSLSEGLVAYYKFNESSGTNITDSSGNDYNGINNNPTGVSITTEGLYTVYTFYSSSTFVPNFSGDLNVYAWGAGGAGGTVGGWGYGSVGGAAGAANGIVRVTSDLNHLIVVGGGGVVNSFTGAVGGGGAASNNNNDNRYSGGGGGYSGLFLNSVSQANALLIAGGGGGGGGTREADMGSGAGSNGGSGGGSSSTDGAAQENGGNATSGQGNDGGKGRVGICPYAHGGGGGAGAVGEDGSPSKSGDGGIGLEYSISGSSVYYAGGGGAGAYNGCISETPGTGGLGGGGNGSDSTVGANGTPNTGGGGGGGAHTIAGGAGGSGIVIIKYLTSSGSATSSSSSNGLWETNGFTFDGSNCITSMNGYKGPQSVPFSISLWFKTNPNPTSYPMLISYGQTNGQNVGGIMFHDSWPGKLFVYSGGPGDAYIISNNRFDDGKWHHAVFSINSSNYYTLFVDGSLEGSLTSSPQFTGQGPDFSIGCSTWNGYNANLFEGDIEEVAIWNRAFSSDEVKDLFSKGTSKIGVQVRSCNTIDCNDSIWSEVQYSSNQFKYFSLPRNQFIQIKVTPELIPFEVPPTAEKCVHNSGTANNTDYCWNYFWDYGNCSAYDWHNSSCYWYEYGYCYPTIDCSYQGGDTCGNYGGCYWNSGYCYNNMECYYNYDYSSCESYPACDWYPYYYCEGSMWSYCYDNFPTEESCTASECYWGGDGCYNNTECYYVSYENCGNYSGYCYPYDYGSCSGDVYSYCAYNFSDEGSCSSQNGCYWNPSYCAGDQYGYCNYNFYDSSSCTNNTNGGCYWNIDYAYCDGDFTCEDQLSEGASSCGAFGQGVCNYTPGGTETTYKYFVNSIPKITDINIFYQN